MSCLLLAQHGFGQMLNLSYSLRPERLVDYDLLWKQGFLEWPNKIPKFQRCWTPCQLISGPLVTSSSRNHSSRSSIYHSFAPPPFGNKWDWPLWSNTDEKFHSVVRFVCRVCMCPSFQVTRTFNKNFETVYNACTFTKLWPERHWHRHFKNITFRPQN